MSLTMASGIIAVFCMIVMAIAWRQELRAQKKAQGRKARRAPNEMRKRFAQLKQNRQS